MPSLRNLIVTNVCVFSLLVAQSGSALAGGADVVSARAEQTASGIWHFDVTVRHADENWDHYADAWQVRAPDGTVLGTRELLHPHVNEQPFTRSLSGVKIPDDVKMVTIHARDSVHGWGGEALTLDLPR